MKISMRRDVEAPMDAVFAALADFPAHERAALRRGVSVERRDRLERPGIGMAWGLVAPIRGREREVDLTLASYSPTSAVGLVAVTGGITATLDVELMALSRRRTRMQIGIEVRAGSMTARLVVQSLKLGKATLERRIERRLDDFARDIETGARRPA